MIMLSGQRLRELRVSLNLSREQLAEKTRLPCSYLEDLEDGRKEPSTDGLVRLASVLPINQESIDSYEWEKATRGLGKKIRALRQSRNLTLNELATLTGLSITYLSEIERESSIPALSTLRNLAAAFNIPVSLFISNKRKASLVGEKLRRIRKLKGLSQKGLATMAGLSPGLIAQLETGKVQASLSTVEKLAQALGVSVCSLILEQDEVEAIVGALSPELRELLYNPRVQTILGATCTMDDQKLKLVLNFVEMLNNPRI